MSWAKAKILQQRFRLHSVIVLIYKVHHKLSKIQRCAGFAEKVAFVDKAFSICAPVVGTATVRFRHEKRRVMFTYRLKL